MTAWFGYSGHFDWTISKLDNYEEGSFLSKELKIRNLREEQTSIVKWLANSELEWKTKSKG